MLTGLDKVPHLLLVEGRFYDDIADHLKNGARAAIEDAGATCESLMVPGALEIPNAIALASESGQFEGFVALGCVIRGETSHYDIVCNESAAGLSYLALRRRLAIGNGILTTDTRDQAIARADPAQKNKGADAANAALRMIAIRARFNPQALFDREAYAREREDKSQN